MFPSAQRKPIILLVLVIWLISLACSLLPKRVTQPNIYQEPDAESTDSLFADFEEDLLNDIQLKRTTHSSGTWYAARGDYLVLEGENWKLTDSFIELAFYQGPEGNLALGYSLRQEIWDNGDNYREEQHFSGSFNPETGELWGEVSVDGYMERGAASLAEGAQNYDNDYTTSWTAKFDGDRTVDGELYSEVPGLFKFQLNVIKGE